MGVGTNIQDRAVALHHLDCPWRPADLAQRDGRIVRQGNQNREVGIYRWVTEASFDAYSWQTVGRKATFIAQVMRGKLDSREIEDIGDTAMSAAEAKALASGNPLVLEKANADSEYQKLRRQETAFHRAQSAVQHTRNGAVHAVEAGESQIAQLRIAASRTTDVAGEAFTMRVGARDYDSRPDAAAAIAQWSRQNEAELFRAGGEPRRVGTIGGHNVTVALERVVGLNSRVEIMARVALEDVPLSGNRMPVDELHNAGVGIVRTLENKTLAIPRNIQTVEQNIEKARTVIVDADASLAKSFAHGDALRAAATRVSEVNAALAASSEKDGDSQAPADATALRARAAVNASFPAPGGSSLGAAPTHAPQATSPRSPGYVRGQ